MFKSILTFELKYWAKNPSLYFYGIILFLFAMLSVAGNAGLFNQTQSGEKSIANSPFALYSLMLLATKLMLFIIPAVIGNSLYRDFKSNSHSLLYSYPITKQNYLSAKFFSSLIPLLLLAMLFLFGCFVGTQLPGINKSLVLPFHISTYVQLFLFYFLPNLLLFSIIVFFTISATQNLYTAYITIIVVLIFREIATRLTASAEISFIAMMIEPFGETATYYYTQNWSLTDQNNSILPISKFFILNRFLWITIAVALTYLTYKIFSFSAEPYKLILYKKAPSKNVVQKAGQILKVELPLARIRFSFLSNLYKSWKLSAIEFKSVTHTGAFASIVLTGAVFVYVLLSQMNSPYGVKVLPVTWVMLAFPVLFFSLLINFITFLYSGFLIHRSNATKMFSLVDSTAIPNWVLAFSKIIALIKIQILLLSIILITGVVVQISEGYYRFEILHYIFDLYGIHLIGFVIWAFIALFIHSLFTNSWLGLFVLILIYFGLSELPLLGIEKYIYRFNQNPDAGFYLAYSDLSGYSHSIYAYFIYKFYWLLFVLIIFTGCLLFWQRGIVFSFKERIVVAYKRLSRKIAITSTVIVSTFICTGYLINVKEESLPRLQTETELNNITFSAHKKYKAFEKMIQPRIVCVNVSMDIYPESLSFVSKGSYTLVNKSNKNIDTLIIQSAFDVVTQIFINQKATLITNDTIVNIYVYKLETALQPMDSLILYFDVKNIPNNIFHKNSLVEQNGTYITSMIYPTIGYRFNNSEKLPTDSLSLNNHYRSADADYIDFEATISTTSNQIAIAPGYLQKKWETNGRNYFNYKSTTPVTIDFAFVSGIYELKKYVYKNLPIEIYYHKNHEYNIQEMINGIKATLEYCEKNFSPYQHEQVRIIEFARTRGDFAQSFANTIPYSELGFIMDIDDENEATLNLPFIGSSHEFAHQWWGMQAIPADVAGAKMITESMAEYVSLKVYEKQYGKIKALQLLNKSLNTYLNKQKDTQETELPLILNAGNSQSHVAYQKGMLAFNALSHYIGEEAMNRALGNYMQKVRLQKAPYTTSLEIIDFIKKETPDSMQYLIHDLFETVTYYDNQIEKIETTKISYSKYEVSIGYSIKKYQKKPNTETLLPLNDYIEIGIYKMGSLLPQEVKMVLVTKSNNQFKLQLDYLPERITIDPNYLLIDIKRDDNNAHF
ncbi:MAG: hypothetical protein IPG60_10345 [Bacteroidetes bacterium]|nr:hypothetical protein [Bacteroidota bacterium]